VVGFTGRGELTHATVSVVLADVGLDQVLSQTHSLSFQVSPPAKPSHNLSPNL